MAYGYWKEKREERVAVFHLYFRNCPFQGGYAIAGGLGQALEYLQGLTFASDDLEYLRGLCGNDGQPLFEESFLEYLRELTLEIDVDAIPEGTIVFPNEPLMRVKGPLLQCQLIETALLNLVNFQTLIATKASRIARMAKGAEVLEFGLRRAQGIDGALAASRAAYLGGCHATSNVLAGKIYGIPVRGTHAHSWVMSFDTELEAFHAYADAMPNNCVFLVDTYDTVEGVKHAIEAGLRLKEKGHRLVGIRLDSGDLAALSIQARKLLDDAGFRDAKIVASNDLDERLMESLKNQGAQISVWGVGTKLVTAFDQPALGGVYKLGAIQDEQGRWHPKLKLSEQPIKTSTPGLLQVRRYFSGGRMVADMLWNELDPPSKEITMVDPQDPVSIYSDVSSYEAVDLVQPVMRKESGLGRHQR